MINAKKIAMTGCLITLSFSSMFASIQSEKNNFSPICFSGNSVTEKTPLISTSKRIKDLNIALKKRNDLIKPYEKSSLEYRKANTLQRNISQKYKKHQKNRNDLNEKNKKVYTELRNVLTSKLNYKKISKKYARNFCFNEVPYKSNTALKIHKIIRKYLEKENYDKAYCEKIAEIFFEKGSHLLNFEKNIEDTKHDYFF